jgi:hypothetical protein
MTTVSFVWNQPTNCDVSKYGTSPNNLQAGSMHAIIGFLTVSFVGVSAIALALAAISDGLSGL